MLDIAFARTALPKSGALALLAHEGEKPSGLWQQADEATGGTIARALEVASFKGAKGKTVSILAPGAGIARVVVVGLGKPAEIDERVLNEAGGAVAALTYEPALADGTLAGARGGTGNFSIVIRGRSAHAGRNPEEGRNAIVAAAALAVRLAEAGGPGLSVNPARIDGGGPNNVVPDLAILRVNFRPAAADAIARAQAAIDDSVAAVAAAHDVRIEVHGRFNRPPKPIDPGAERLFACVADAGADLGLSIGWRATGGVCDGNNIAAAGVPVVDTMGVRGGAIHSTDEFMIVDSLAERAALSALTISRIVQRGRP